jgi:O-antigen/teichoic acid export membrane protein
MHILKKYQKILANIFWSNVKNITLTLSSVIISIFFVRSGNIDLYGQYLFVIGVIGIVSIVSIPGVKTAIFKAVSQGHDLSYITGTQFSFKWGLLAVPILLVAGCIYFIWFNKILGGAIIVSAILIPFIHSITTWQSYLKGKSQFRKLALWEVLKTSLQSTAVIISMILTNNLIIVIVSYLSVITIFNLIFSKIINNQIVNTSVAKNLIKDSYSLTLLNFSDLIFGRMDIVLIGIFVESSQIAVYGLVMKFVDIFIKVISSAIVAISPKIWTKKSLRLSSFYRFFIISAIFPIIIFHFLEYPINLLYGSGMGDVVKYSQIYMFIVPIYFVLSTVETFLIRNNLLKEMNRTRLAATVLVCICYIVLIPKIGVLGGVYGSMIYYLFIAISYFYYYRKNTKLIPNENH